MRHLAWLLCVVILAACSTSPELPIDPAPVSATSSAMPVDPPAVAARSTPAPSASAAVEPAALPLPPPGAEVVELAKKVAETQIELAHHDFEDVRTPTEAAPRYELSLAGRQALKRLKDEAMAVAAARLNELPDRMLERGALRSAFEAGGVSLYGEKEDPNDGYLWAGVEPAPGNPDRSVVTLCERIFTGVDCVVIVYHRHAGRLEPELVVRHDDYAGIGMAISECDWSISLPDDNDEYVFVVAYTYPWISSNWRDFGYQALTPTADPRHPRELAAGREVGRWVDGFTPVAALDHFTVGYAEMSWFANDYMTPRRTHVHWRRSATGWEQRANEPVRPQDILAEWLAARPDRARYLQVDPAAPDLAATRAHLVAAKPSILETSWEVAELLSLGPDEPAWLNALRYALLPDEVHVTYRCGGAPEDCHLPGKSVVANVVRTPDGWRLKALSLD